MTDSTDTDLEEKLRILGRTHRYSNATLDIARDLLVHKKKVSTLAKLHALSRGRIYKIKYQVLKSLKALDGSQTWETLTLEAPIEVIEKVKAFYKKAMKEHQER